MLTFTTGSTAKYSATVLTGEDASGMLDVFPNPSFGQFNVVYHLGEYDDGQLEVVSSVGQVVYIARVNGGEAAITHQVALPRIAAGVYYVRVRSSDLLLTKRIVVQ